MTRTSPSRVETTDLTAASFLAYHGHTPSIEVRQEEDGRSVGVWIFPPEAEGWFMLYKAGEASVEPRRFHRCLTTTRRSLFEKLNEG